MDFGTNTSSYALSSKNCAFATKTIEKIQNKKDDHMILYCHTGSRSYQVQHIMKTQGFKYVGNLMHGIVSYNGEIER